jgi:hypothetical protein
MDRPSVGFNFNFARIATREQAMADFKAQWSSL